MEIQSTGDEVRVERIGVALAPKSNAQLLLDWTIQQGAGELFLVYVRPTVRTIPTPLGKMPVSQVSPEKLEPYMAIREARTQDYRRELEKLCELRQVNGIFVLVDSDRVGKALVEQIQRFNFTKFVVGASSKGLSFKVGISDYVLKHAPKSCRVQCVAKSSKLLRESKVSYEDNQTRIVSFPSGVETQAVSGEHSSEIVDSPRSTITSDDTAGEESSLSSPSFSNEHLQEIVECALLVKHLRLCLRCEMQAGDHAAEVAKLRHQLQQAIFAGERAKEFARNEIARTKELCEWNVKKVNGLRRVPRNAKVVSKLQMEILRAEEQKRREAAVMASEMANKKFEEESQKRAEAALLAETTRIALEREIERTKTTLENEIERRKIIEEKLTETRAVRYQQFTYEELQVMTSDFSNKLGEGSFYRGSLHHTEVAVKVLNRDRWQGPEEIETLSRLNHPQVALLLGGNSEHGCLVYEYLENGSLHDHLFKRGSEACPMLPCSRRYAIAVQVATAILYLHRASPMIVHGHLKPSNILLDKSFNCKVSEITLPTSQRGKIPLSPEELAYLEPGSPDGGSEQLTLSPTCDVYSFGIILLQLLTASSPIGIVAKVANAVDGGSLNEILDCNAGEWALEAAMQLACIGLTCTETQRENRAELESVLQMLKELQKNCCNQTVKQPQGSHSMAPALFDCPIMKEVMEFPVLASDGYTYEYEGIRRWLEKSQTSPMTNLPLESRSLMPNRLVRSAICEWKLSQARNLEP